METFPSEHVLAPLAKALINRSARLCTAESCTGGLIAACCTSIAGSSAWFERGFVTYTNTAKAELLDVPMKVINDHGAVSEAVAHEMALGALRHSHAHYSISVTGIAGPGGGSATKPIGLVWFGFASRDNLLENNEAAWHVETQQRMFSGDRHAVRVATVIHALEKLLLIAS